MFKSHCDTLFDKLNTTAKLLQTTHCVLFYVFILLFVQTTVDLFSSFPEYADVLHLVVCHTPVYTIVEQVFFFFLII